MDLELCSTQAALTKLSAITAFLQNDSMHQETSISGSELEELDDLQCECQRFLEAYERWLDA